VDDHRKVLSERYEIGDLLGRGGMAVVHAGHDIRLGRQVAIKMLRADLARDPSFHARFRREAQSAAALNHPSIVSVYDTGEDVLPGIGGADEHIPFIIMEHVEGHTLREILHDEERNAQARRARAGSEQARTDRMRKAARGPDAPTGLLPSTATDADTHHDPDRKPEPMPVDEAVKVTAGVLSALEFSHRAGIVHRDIKPANVMLTTTNEVKVMDFGIARAMADASATMTQTQAVIGTAQYLSPEQARGETVDARSDLYSTGCLLFELLTGRPPFVGDSPVSVAYQHVREIPQPPSTFNPSVGADLDRVVLHALAKDRDDRYPDAHAFRADLLAALEGRPVHAPVPAADTTMAMPAAAAGVAGVAPVPVDATQVFAARTADPARTVTIGHLEEEDEPRQSRAAGYVLLALAVLAVFGFAAWLVTQVLADDETSSQATTVSVPDLTGKTVIEAKSLLDQADLGYKEGTAQNSATVPFNVVISQSPPEGAPVDRGSAVTVVLSLGVGEIEVPVLTGLTQAEARSKLQEVGLRVGDLKSVNDPEVEKDRVISSTPPAAAKVARNAEVAVVVSTGLVTLPDLTGRSYPQARVALLGLGLSSSAEPEENGAVPVDTVLSQNPAAGSVPQGSSVVLSVAAAPPTTTTTTTTTEPTTTEPTTTEPTTTEPTTTEPTTTEPTTTEPTTTAPTTTEPTTTEPTTTAPTTTEPTTTEPTTTAPTTTEPTTTEPTTTEPPTP